MNYRWNDARFMTGLKRDFHFNDTPLLPPSLLLVRSFRCFNQRGGGGSIIRGTEVGTKGADQRMAEIKTPINCRWAMREEGKVACKIYTKTIHFLRDSTSVNCNQRLRNELNKIQEEFPFPSRSIFKTSKEHSFFSQWFLSSSLSITFIEWMKFNSWMWFIVQKRDNNR